jgi:23S rRNA (adenine2503-C2)-methyltransferase
MRICARHARWWFGIIRIAMKKNPIPNLYDLTQPELEALLREWGQPAYRAKQIERQLYVNYVASAAEMTDLPLPLRERLAAETRLEPLQPLRLQQADGGMTQKALFELDGGAVVESVLMVYPDRATVCVSTQAGCAMDCSFCATGRLGLLRNLSPGEIVGQVLWAARVLRELAPDHGPRTTDQEPRSNDRGPATMGRGRANGVADAIWWSPEGIEEQQEQRAGNFVPRVGRLTNVVFMGMGEPFANYDRWWRAVERLHDPRGFNMGARGLTVSTVGLVPGIRRLAEAPLPINLAISLHAANAQCDDAGEPALPTCRVDGRHARIRIQDQKARLVRVRAAAGPERRA